jgi:hypothetical protein
LICKFLGSITFICPKKYTNHVYRWLEVHSVIGLCHLHPDEENNTSTPHSSSPFQYLLPTPGLWTKTVNLFLLLFELFIIRIIYSVLFYVSGFFHSNLCGRIHLYCFSFSVIYDILHHMSKCIFVFYHQLIFGFKSHYCDYSWCIFWWT